MPSLPNPEPGLAAVFVGRARPARACRSRGTARANRCRARVPPVLQRPVGVDARLVRERVAANPGPGGRQRLPERVRRPQPEPPGPGQIERIPDRRRPDDLTDPEPVPERQDARQQVGVAGPLTDSVHARVDPGVLAGVEVTERAGHRVRHGHAQVVVAVRLDRDADGGGELGEPLPDPPGRVAADGVAVPDPERAGFSPGNRTRAQAGPPAGGAALLPAGAGGSATLRSRRAPCRGCS